MSVATSRISLRPLDPFLGRLAELRPLDTARVAYLYALLAFGSTCLVAWFEGRLVHIEVLNLDGESTLVYPLILNLSTLVDFLVLNPLTIYIILDVCKSVQALEEKYGAAGFRYSRAHQLTTALAWLIAAILSMAAYLHFFFEGEYLDAIVARNSHGDSFLTSTGWVASFWTVLFMYTLGQALFAQILYLRVISQLTSDAISYHPFSSDEAAGLRSLAEPAAKFLRLNFMLLLILSLFALQDKVLFNVDESIRDVGVVIYLAVSVPLFLVPLFKLRSAMKLRRARIADSIFRMLERSALEPVDRLGTTEIEVANSLKALEDIQSCLKKLPTWPLPFRQSLEGFTILAGPAFTLIPKIKLVLGVVTVMLGDWLNRLGVSQ